MLIRRIAAVLLPLLGVLCVLGVASADEDVDRITLQPGSNVVTWSGTEPYAISNFEGTPITEVHRFDAVHQEWLTHFVGQAEATLPELHLLPRVQYLLVADQVHELSMPNPMFGVDPLVAVRQPAEPDDPLRIVAHYPNEDSPLDDLVVLRGKSERLSVRAEVAGGAGDVSVWWMIDGRVNHSGLASDDVELIPGGYDHGRLYAVDASGHVASTRLPRLVKLAPFELLKRGIAYGTVAHFSFGPRYYSTEKEVEAAADLMAEAGMRLVRTDLSANLTPARQLVEHAQIDFDSVFSILQHRSLQVLAIVGHGPPSWASSRDVSRLPWGGVSHHDSAPAQQMARLIARRWPTQLLYEIGNEPNLSYFSGFLDPVAWAEHHKAVALGIWYETPDAVIVSAGICCFDRTGGDSHVFEPRTPDAHTELFYGADVRGFVVGDGNAFLAEAYKSGWAPYFDVAGIHPTPHQHHSYERFFARFLEVMDSNGDANKPLWVTETAGAPYIEDRNEYARYLAEELRIWSNHPRVQAIITYNFRDKPPPNDILISGLVEREFDDGYAPKPTYWAVREFITGKPPPDN